MKIILFIIGLIFGSFGSVLIARLSSNKLYKKELKSVIRGRSHCPKCKKNLKPQNLIPLLSYVIQTGRCDFCKQKISSLYIIIEILSGLVFLSTYVFIPYHSFFELAVRLLINRILLLLMIYDFIKYELHIPILIFGLAISLIPQFLNIIGDYKIAFISSILLFAIFVLIYYLAKLYVKHKYKKDFEGIGFGDVILAFFIGTLFPFIFLFHNIHFDTISLISLSLSFVLISSISGIIIWAAKTLINIRPKGLKHIKDSLCISGQHIIPFLPAMIISYRILLFWAPFVLKIFLA